MAEKRDHTADHPVHAKCGKRVDDAGYWRDDPSHDPCADWYCPTCEQYYVDQELDVMDPRELG